MTETAIFVCSICAEVSDKICAYCTKDTCDNHFCIRCKGCSDCCECEVPLVEERPAVIVAEPVLAEAPAAIPEAPAAVAEPPAAVAEPPATVAEPPAIVAEPPATVAEPPVMLEEHTAEPPSQAPDLSDPTDCTEEGSTA